MDRNDSRQSLGDDQGTRVGSPDTPSAHGEGGAAERPRVGEKRADEKTQTDAGAEATKNVRDGEHSHEHESGYGGRDGEPKNY